jgi:hypothetical protein
MTKPERIVVVGLLIIITGLLGRSAVINEPDRRPNCMVVDPVTGAATTSRNIEDC